MKEFTLNEIAQKYLEYKEILDKVERGEYDVYFVEEGQKISYTTNQVEMMRKIVTQLDDLGFGLIVRRLN